MKHPVSAINQLLGNSSTVAQQREGRERAESRDQTAEGRHLRTGICCLIAARCDNVVCLSRCCCSPLPAHPRIESVCHSRLSSSSSTPASAPTPLVMLHFCMPPRLFAQQNVPKHFGDFPLFYGHRDNTFDVVPAVAVNLAPWRFIFLRLPLSLSSVSYPCPFTWLTPWLDMAST